MDECELYGSITQDDGLTDWFDVQPTFGVISKDIVGPPIIQVDDKEDNTVNSENVLAMWQEAEQELHAKVEDEMEIFRNNIFCILAEQRMHCEFLFGLNHPDCSGIDEESDINSRLHIVPQNDQLPRDIGNDSMSDTSVHTYYEPSDQSFESETTVRYSGAVGSWEDLNSMALRTLTLCAQVFRRLSQLYVAS